jgi:prepilin-type processing-associated H-X9-DG protein
LAGTQAQSKTTACTARFRQWAASANLYANDNRGWLPTADPAGGGAFAWDVGLSFPGMLYPYGMDVPVWFCPMRPAALDEANAWAKAALGHPIQNTNDLRQYWSRSYANEVILNDNYWVPRYNGTVRPANPTLFPPDYPHLVFPPAFIKAGNPTCLTYGWPQRLHDVAAPFVPFVSDLAASGQSGGLHSPHGASTNVNNFSPNSAHFVNGTLIGVNLAFADGHVASHTPGQMRAVYFDGANYWFY